jgi:OmpA-OmpF porin, OOP family
MTAPARGGLHVWRTTGRWALLALAVTSAAAFGQPTPVAADIETQWLDPSARGSLWVGNGLTLPAQTWRLAVALTGSHSNLRSAEGGNVYLRDRLGLTLAGAIGFTGWLEGQVVVPVHFFQTSAPSSAGITASPAGLGNPWLLVKLGILDSTRPLNLSLTAGFGVPVGTSSAFGNGGPEGLVRLNAGRAFQWLQFGVDLTVLMRQAADFSPLTRSPADVVGSHVSVGAMVTTMNRSGVRPEISVRAYVPLTTARFGLEAQAGVRWPISDLLELFGSLGPGVGGEPSTPTLRGMVGVAFGNVGLTPPACVEGEAYDLVDCPQLDRDSDGLKNAVDACPLSGEDLDDFEDGDGCPEPDNDGDAVPDAADACSRERGIPENNGCPDSDSDGDGVIDRLDRCPRDREDADGFEDADGCPDPDNDGDAVGDAADACPLEPGLREEHGCPARDDDADGVPDHLDACARDKGPADNQGCPARRKVLVALGPAGLILKEPVAFEGPGLSRRSLPTVEQLAQVLVEHPSLRRLSLGLHETPGAPAGRTRARLEAVKGALVRLGVAPERLETAVLEPSPEQKVDLLLSILE